MSDIELEDLLHEINVIITRAAKVAHCQEDLDTKIECGIQTAKGYLTGGEEVSVERDAIQKLLCDLADEKGDQGAEIDAMICQATSMAKHLEQALDKQKIELEKRKPGKSIEIEERINKNAANTDMKRKRETNTRKGAAKEQRLIES